MKILAFGTFMSALVLVGCSDAKTENAVTDNSVSVVRNGGAQTIDVINIKVPVEVFAQNIASGEYTVLDVRTPEEYAAGRITDDAMNINFYADDFRSQLAALPKDAKYLIYCRSGGRSGQTLSLMKDLGFLHVEDLKGGMNAWQKDNRPVVK